MKHSVLHSRSRFVAPLSLLAFSAALANCATYEGAPPDASSSGAAGSNAGISAGGAAGQASGTAGAVSSAAGADNSSGGIAGTSAGGANGGAADAGRGGMPSAGSGGSAGSAAGGSGGKGGAGGGTAGTSSAGMSSSAGTGGATAGSGGVAAGNGGAGTGSGGGGNGGTAGTGGTGTVADKVISLTKAASADSNQTGHLAADGNDASLTTRWCAADGAVGHHWEVDLGTLSTLSKLQITWEKAVNYRFKVEGSADGSVWQPLLDQSTTTNAAAVQTYPLSASPQARIVRLTVTGLPNTTTWASFFDFSVYGH